MERFANVFNGFKHFPNRITQTFDIFYVRRYPGSNFRFSLSRINLLLHKAINSMVDRALAQ